MRFKTKVIEIDAWKWDCGQPMPEWFASRTDDTILYLDNDPSAGYIKTIDGRVGFTPKHWILCDTEGNIYPCHDTVFQKKYERV